MLSINCNVNCCAGEVLVIDAGSATVAVVGELKQPAPTPAAYFYSNVFMLYSLPHLKVSDTRTRATYLCYDGFEHTHLLS